jgi:uncharacterized membrane protein
MFVAIAIHVLAAIIWVGGMFFAYVCLRPVAASLLPPPQRLPLWVQTFERFFPFVWGAVVALPVTGVGLAVSMFGGMATWPIYVHAMFGLGLAMIAIFMHVYFAPFRRLRRAVAQGDFSTGGQELGQIRRLVGINLVLGLVVALIASAGRMY